MAHDTSQDVMHCPFCGAANAPDAQHCTSCGHALPGAHAPKAPALGPEPGALRGHTLPENTRDEFRALSYAQTADLSTVAGRETDERPTPEGLEEPSLPAPSMVDELPEGARRLTLGYDADNDIVIPKPNISGHHAILARKGNKYYLQDRNSTNGTFVNGHKITACALVHPGDRVALGSYNFTLDLSLTSRLDQDVSLPTQALPSVQAAATASHQKTRQVIIGRDPDCDIILDAPQISRQHVRFTQMATGWLVEDLGSANGTFLGDRHTQPITRAEVTERDVIFMGSYRFPISRLRDFLGDRYAQSEKSRLAMPLDKKIITIGRGSDNDIVIDAPQVSRHHARLVRKDKSFFLEDLASANGTFINGERIGRAALGAHDTVSFGTYAVHMDLARGAIQKSYRGDILLQAENIRVDVVNPNKSVRRLLDGVSFTAYPTEFIGVMGPSGAGKTTLLMSMIGYLKPTYGRTLLNGDELSTHYDRYRGAIGYVPQEDIIHGELTVYEALYYTAKLRLPPDTDDAEIDRRIMAVLSDLEIADTRDVRIGSPERKGISGGQRKRVNLALELLTQPSLLCLDEPTSGLASEDAVNVMRLLRKLADQGRTILLTILQPSLLVYRKLDNVLYLADGEQVYYGPAYPDSMLYFHPGISPGSPEAEEVLSDPGSCLRPLVDAKRAGEPMETFAARYRQSQYHREYVEERRDNQAEVNLTGTGERKPPRFSMHQLLTLCRRYMAIKFKDRVGTTILLIQAPIIGLLIVLVFAGLESGVLNRMEYMPFAHFLMVISAMWFGCSNAAREIVAEQAIYKRERMVNLAISAYVGSKFLVLAGFTLIQCLALLSITWALLDFTGNPLFHLIVLWACALAGTGMGLMLSAIVRTTPAALALVPLLLIPQVILGGAIMPIHRMEDPAWTLSYTQISRWGFEGMMQTEHLSDAFELSAADLPKPLGPGLPSPPPPPNPLDRFFGDTETWLAVDLGVLLGFTVVLLIGTAVTLRVRER